MLDFLPGLNHHLKFTIYTFDPGLKSLVEKPPDQQSISISAVTLNRLPLTLRLLKSIEEHWSDFQGQILLADNGSDPIVLAELKNFLAGYKWKVSLLEIGQNLGPAKARNLMLEACKTEWLLLLDNDMYFVSDPLPSLKETVEKLAVNFLNLPFLGIDGKHSQGIGGNLFLKEEGGTLKLNCGNSFRPALPANLPIESPFLSTFLCAGASCVRTEIFRALGGFDDELYAFEDLDFSLKLYKAGIKIGNAHRFHLIHGHEKAETQLDRSYERVRHSQETIKASTDRIFAKYGVQIWSKEVESWLQERLKVSGLQQKPSAHLFGLNQNFLEKIASKSLGALWISLLRLFKLRP
ncbi:MAG: glycosyltransferase [Candidatus Caenarcaniphilales bacterium]|nr:glycosyltransferase [Candidatus Caenarcaniphilales bacterium]